MRGKQKGLLWAFWSCTAILGVCLLFPASGNAASGINQQINFQGKLTNTDGTNVTDGTYSIRFRIYSDPSLDATNTCSPGTNTCLWEETQGGVSVSSGIFQVALGSVNTTLDTAVNFNNSPLYLGIKVGTDSEMTPRIQLTAAPYAFNAEKLGGIGSSGFVQLSPASPQSGNINVSGNITAGGTYNGNTFTGSSLQFSTASTSSIQGAASQAFNIDSGASGSLSLGAGNASGVTLGKTGITVSVPGSFSVSAGSTVPTADQVVIDNTAATGVTTANVNGLDLKYKGGAAAVESAGLHVDFTPGATTGGTWSAMRIATTAGAATGVTQYGLKIDANPSSNGGTNEGLYVGSGWNIGLDLQSGGIQLTSQSDPAAPAAGNIRIYAKTVAGRTLPKWLGPYGVDTPFQASFGFNRIAMMAPSGNGTSATTLMTGWGSNFTNNAGSYSDPILTSTNLMTSVRRASMSPATNATGSMAYHAPAALQVWRGNAAGLGGFFYTIRFDFAALLAGNYAFVGLVDTTTAPTSADPTTSTTYGKLGIGINSNTGNLKFINNISGTAPTVTDLGGTIPLNNTDLYELIIFSPPNGSGITYRVQDISTAAKTADTTVTTNIPASTSFLAPEYWLSTGTSKGTATIESAGWYLESDN